MTELHRLVQDGALRIRTAADGARFLDARVLPWDTIGRPDAGGPEIWRRGALAGTDPASVVLRMDHLDPPAGRGATLEERDDGAYMSFLIADTLRGNELAATVDAGLEQNVSIGFRDVPGGSRVRYLDGEPVLERTRADVREVSTTWRPVYTDAAILAMRARMDGGGDVTEQIEPAAVESVPAPAPAPNPAEDSRLDAILTLLERQETRSRQEAVTLPTGLQTRSRRSETAIGPDAARWMDAALAQLSGERVPVEQMRALADLITSDNLGIVPDSIRTELIGLISAERPFLNSVREVPAGSTGLKIVFPRIVNRPVVGIQTAEKTEIASGETTIDTAEYGAQTIAGGGDLSIQLIRRSGPAFQNLFLQLLAEQLALAADNAAVDVLLAAGVTAGGAPWDPAAPAFGEAWTNAAGSGRPLRPDRIWLSSAAYAGMMDATVTDTTGLPRYPGLAPLAGITGTAGGGPEQMTMTPVWVPALDDEAVDVIIGPSRGFAFAEDGAFTLQADVPARLGRDVALASLYWFMPIYPAAFTTYALAPVVP